jgi:pimeloyl-ACP methyl ester carboxylesterase
VTRSIEIDLEMWLDGPRRAAAQVDPVVRARMREWVAATYAVPGELGPERHLEPPALARLGEVRATTLIVVGDLDMPEMLPAADRLSREIPNARKVVIPGAAHMVNLEYPEDFNRVVLDFLNA